jgi:hypothetical protein
MSTVIQAPAAAVPVSQGILRRAWEGWKRFAHVLGVFNTRVIMTVLYFLIVLPVGVIFRMVSDPLQLAEPKETNWVELPPQEHALEEARQQF